MKEIEINDMEKYIENSPLEMNLMFIGDTGIGKTQGIKKWAKNNGKNLKILILSQIRADESLGVPVQSEVEFRDEKKSTLESAIPLWVYQLADDPNAVLFLDEFFTAKPDVMNAFLNLLSEKEVNGIDLSHVRIIAATNLGMYSFKPDMNILSRFCFFYAVNTTYNKYINDPRIPNNYEDELDRSHLVFEKRSLKPRCQETLSKVKNDDLLDDYHQGYTNRNIYLNYSKIKEVDNFFVDQSDIQNKRKVSLDGANIGSFIQFIISNYPRVKNAQNILDSLTENVLVQQKIDDDDILEFINFRLSI